MPTDPPTRQPPTAVVQFAAAPFAPIKVLFVDGTLEVALAWKASIPAEAGLLDKVVWAVPGVYVLIGPTTEEASTTELVRARPGSGGDLLHRLRDHPRESPWFERALLVRDTRQGFNSAQAGYLEGRLHVTCAASTGVEHVNRQDHDSSLQEHEEAEMNRRYLPPALAALRFAGLPLDSPPDL